MSYLALFLVHNFVQMKTPCTGFLMKRLYVRIEVSVSRVRPLSSPTLRTLVPD